MNQCAHNDFLRADRELNKTYKALIRKSAGNRGYIRALRKSQRAWMKFRDAELNAIFYCAERNIRICWGSMIGVLYPNAKADLTRDRTKQLKKYLEKSEGDL
nr:lysozyme inhibitor LprI family protein [Candidatus Marithrix sp. Canyon 246]